MAALAMATLGACAKSTPAGSDSSYPLSVAPTSSAAPSGPAFTHKSTIDDVLKAARSGLTKLGTYAYGTYDKDIAAAESYLTASYGARFKANADAQKATAEKLHSVSKVSGMTVAVSAIGADLESAQIVAGFSQIVTGTSVPHRRVNLVAAEAGLIEVNGKWQINALAIPPNGPAVPTTYTLATDDLSAAVAAGTRTVVTVGTLRRKHLGYDYAKWLDATTGALHDKLAKAEKATEASMKNARADLSATCKTIGVETINSSTKVTLLAYVTATGVRTSATLSEVTMEKVKGSWLAEQIKTFGR
ncbi:hypothetical protein [Jatrophihabitans sp.]|uniref:hypothetical protein n=1 Tax=Jatrophihabitans sp. TaxID=1932789 RepID=UPI0030C76142